MTKADDIREELARLQAELERLAPHEKMGARELARATDTSATTASRFKAGETSEMQMSTVVKFMPFTRSCPLCGADVDPDAWGGASTKPQADGVLDLGEVE